MARGVAAIILVILIIGGVSGYLFYTRYVQGTVVLSITDPPQATHGTVKYDPSILHIYITFSTIDIHQVGISPNNNTWIPIHGSQTTIDMISALTTSKTLGNAKLSTGTYDQVRFPITTAIVTFTSLGNVTYAVPSGSLKVTITGGGFQSTPGTNTNLLLTLSFNNNEILAMNGNLTPHSTAQVTG